MKFNEAKLNESKRILLEAYENENFIFSEFRETFKLPPNIKKGSKEHALYLFFVAPATYYADSEVLWKNFENFYSKHPEFFDPNYIVENFFKTEGKIIDSRKRKLKSVIAENLHHGFSSEIALRWYENSLKLYNDYAGDPREIFRNVFNAKDALEKLDVNKKKSNRFRGFGQKTGNLLLMWFSRGGFLEEEFDIYSIEVPFDKHAINFSVGHEIIKVFGEPHKREFINFAKENFKKNFMEDKTDPREFTDAQWILGSKVCILNNCKEAVQKKCPFSESCRYKLDSSSYYEFGRIKVIENVI